VCSPNRRNRKGDNRPVKQRHDDHERPAGGKGVSPRPQHLDTAAQNLDYHAIAG